MTENEKNIKQAIRCVVGACDETCYHWSSGVCRGYEEVAKGLEKALEEIQQYRAIGTVGKQNINDALLELTLIRTNTADKTLKATLDMFISALEVYKFVKENFEKPLKRVRKDLNRLAEFEKNGTIDEFKVFKEKSVAKKAIGKREYNEAYCPCCNEVISDGEFWALNEYVHHCNECGQAVKGVDWE